MRSFAEHLREIVGRTSGPFAFRFYLQPLMATFFAVRDGIQDAKAGRPAYLWSLCTDPAGRRERLRHGWRSVGKIFVLAVVLDLLYELIVLRGVRPLQGLIIAAGLALVPYVLLRGPANRIYRRLLAHRRAAAH